MADASKIKLSNNIDRIIACLDKGLKFLNLILALNVHAVCVTKIV